jgi:hypothetical protein
VSLGDQSRTAIRPEPTAAGLARDRGSIANAKAQKKQPALHILVNEARI